MKNIYRQIKWAYQRVVRGYDDRVNWGFDFYFLDVMPELKKFCKGYLENDTYRKNNPERFAVFSKTVKLIEEWENQDSSNMWSEHRAREKLLKYVGAHATWYWN